MIYDIDIKTHDFKSTELILGGGWNRYKVEVSQNDISFKLLMIVQYQFIPA